MRERTRFENEVGGERPPVPATPPVVKPPAAVTAWSLQVVEGSGKPLDGDGYAAYQGTSFASGVLVKGRADMGRVDPLKPFRFEVRGRACAIREGAVLVADDASVEYGGTEVDWSEADSSTADKDFWPRYSTYRRSTTSGPNSFWQHEHITRRPIRIRQSWAQTGSKKTAVIVAVPVRLRVGPLVRFTNADSAVIWLETHTPALVRVRFDKQSNKRAALADRFASTVRVGGRHYAVVVLDGLTEATRYDYTIELAPQQAAGGVLVEQTALRKAFPSLSATIRASMQTQLSVSSFNGSEWLTFRTLQKRYEQTLRFAYGSCRRFPSDQAGKDSSGPDALEAFQTFMAKRVPDKEWPQFLLLVGDQIYADDIGHQQGVAIGRQRWARRIPGRTPREGEGAWAGRFAARFTGAGKAPRNQKFRIDNHLLWNVPIDAKNTHTGLLYPKQPAKNREDRPAGDTKAPPHPEIPPTGEAIEIHAADFAEYAFLYEAAWTRPERVRKVFANLPSFMVFDDHEITDDWNADRRWLDNVFRPPANAPEFWPETIVDGLASYWLYQGWGNLAPAEWPSDPRTSLLLTHQKAGTDALASLRAVIGRDREPPAKNLAWDYALPIQSPIFFATDCRMRRVLRPTKPSFDDQVLDKAGLDKMLDLLRRSTSPVAFLISSLPILLPGLIAESFRFEQVSATFLGIPGLGKTKVLDEKVRRGLDIEHWVANQSWFDVLRFLASLSKESPNLKTLVALSGDVHFSFNMLGRLDPKLDIPKKMNLRPPRVDADGRAFPYLLQMVSSGIKQQLPAVKQYRARLLVEDDALLPPAFNDETSTDLRRLARGIPVSNRLYSTKYTRKEYDFGGMQLRLGGYNGIDNPRRTLLMDNSVAVVDLLNDPKHATFKLVESYVTSRLAPSYTFELTTGGVKQTVPRFT